MSLRRKMENMLPPIGIANEMLQIVTIRQRAMFKLRTGDSPLNDDELQTVKPEKREDACKVKPRLLRQVGALFGISKERVRQIINRTCDKLGIEPET